MAKVSMKNREQKREKKKKNSRRLSKTRIPAMMTVGMHR